ncbi:hypothetical protein BGX30_001462, partial [Mortierella sp. GBA39]
MTVQCNHGEWMCFDVGYEATLPVREHGQEERLYCKQCRQTMCREEAIVEEIPARLHGYANEYCGQNIVSMLTKSEATMIYNLRL